MKKIMFNDRYGLTTAVLEGRKTMTRRAVSEKLLEAYYDYDDYVCAVAPGDIPCTREYEQEFFLRRSLFEVGEVVAVAQSYKNIGLIAHLYEPGWWNKMFVRAELMPHHIRITDVRVERLRDITEGDCLREGIYKRDPAPGVPALFAYDTTQDQDGHMLATTWYTTARGAFSGLIDKVSGKGTWGDNPWVFVYEFELVKED